MTLPELRRIAEAATQGEWVESTSEDWSTDEVSRVGNGWIDGVVEYGECGMHRPKWSKSENLAHVLAFNPQTVLKLLDDYEKMEAALEFYSEMGTIYQYPNGWRCSKAGGPPEMDDYDLLEDAGETARSALSGLEMK